jgi:hypothetical protein
MSQAFVLNFAYEEANTVRGVVTLRRSSAIQEHQRYTLQTTRRSDT